MTEFEKARAEYRAARAGDFPEVERVAAQKYIAQLESEVADLRFQVSSLRQRNSGKW